MDNSLIDKSLIDNIMRIIIAINYGIVAGFIVAIINVYLGFGAAVFMTAFLTLCFYLTKYYIWG